MKKLGDFEFTVMSAVLALKDDAYGVLIREEVADKTQKNVAIGAVYTTLARLEKKGLVTSRQGEPTAERGGRAKRYYTVTVYGREMVDATLSAMREALERMVST